MRGKAYLRILRSLWRNIVDIQPRISPAMRRWPVRVSRARKLGFVFGRMLLRGLSDWSRCSGVAKRSSRLGGTVHKEWTSTSAQPVVILPGVTTKNGIGRFVAAEKS